MTDMRSILLVHGDTAERQPVAAALRREIGCVVLEAATVAQAEAILQKQEVCLLMVSAPGDGTDFAFMARLRQLNPETALIVCVPHQDRRAGVEALKRGAFCHIGTPFETSEAVIAAARGLEHHDLLVHKQRRGPKFRKSDGFHGIVGQGAKMRQLFALVEKVAEDSASTVLIQGETGTGKELVARAIHAHSPRQEKNFVPVNCAAIPDELLESELFGYVKGAFTGATQSKMGRLQYADGGTLFLDEIGDMKPALQAKLLRVLQEKAYEPVGGVKPVPVDVRVIAATHRDLEKAVAEGTFREDLFYRLSVVPLHLPPLRERPEEIPLLVDKFMQAFNRNRKEAFLGFAPEALAALVDYPWPGNVRELENLVQRLSVLHGGMKARLADLPEKYRAQRPTAGPPVAPPASPLPLAEGFWQGEQVDFNALVQEFEDQLILAALERTQGNKREAARLLSLNRTTLIEKIKKKGLG